MTDALETITAILVFGLLEEVIVRKTKLTRERINPTILRCSACDSRCRRRFNNGSLSWQWWAQIAVWCLAIVPLLHLNALPTVWVLTLGVVIAHFTSKAEDRLYHHWWAWRHPVRCGGHGDLVPAKSSAR